MNQIELSYEETKQEMIEEVRSHQFGFLATTDGGSAYVREIRFVPNGLTLYCFTDRRSRKRKQIQKNHNVAVAYGNHKIPTRGLQIEGTAILRGHPLDDECKEMLEAYKDFQPEAFERSMKRHFVRSRPDLSVIEIVPKKVTLMVQGKTAPETYVDIIDIEKERATRLMLNIGNTIKSPIYQE